MLVGVRFFVRGGQGAPPGHALGQVVLQAAHIAFQVALGSVQFVAQAHDLLNARQIHAEFLGEPPDLAQVLDVALAVQPRFAAAASGADQLLAFVEAQRLGVHVHQFRRDGNDVHGPVAGVGGLAGRGQGLRACLLAQFSLDALDLGLEFALQIVQLVLQAHDFLHARQVHAEFLGEPPDLAQVLDIALAVKPGLAAAAPGPDQALAFVEAQRLRVHVHQFRRHRNDVYGTLLGVGSHKRA